MKYDSFFITADGREVYLTDDELKVVRALRRLNKMNFGRLMLFAGSGGLSIRFDGGWQRDSIVSLIKIPCDGGDGGDNS